MYKQIALIRHSCLPIACRTRIAIPPRTTVATLGPGKLEDYTPSSGPSITPTSKLSICPTPRNFTTETVTPSRDVRILAAIKQEHREIKADADTILNGTTPDQQTRYQNQFTWELARHMIGEELIVYPALVKYVKNGQKIADEGRAEHQDIKEQLKMFQGLRSTDPRFTPTLRALMGDLENHIRKEEDQDFARLEVTISKEESEALTRSLNQTKMFIPSRPHPLVPTKPPFETAVGLLTAPIDMVADMFRKWPKERKGNMSASR
jgi:hemerythrin superfamily protein